jgi:hypothetical protein
MLMMNMTDKKEAVAIEALEEKIRFYEAEVARLQKIQEELQALKIALSILRGSAKPPTQAVEALRKKRRKRNSVTNLAEAVLREMGQPMSSSQLVEALKQRGKVFKAKRPQDTIRKSLERDPAFRGVSLPSSREIHWALTEWGDQNVKEKELGA